MSHRKVVAALGLALFCIAFASGGNAFGQSKAPAPAKIDLNKATVEQLGRFPGLTPVLARAIAEYRDKSGPFKTTEDLLKVRGMTKEILRPLNPKLDKGALYITPAPQPSEEEEEPSLEPSKC